MLISALRYVATKSLMIHCHGTKQYARRLADTFHSLITNVHLSISVPLTIHSYINTHVSPVCLRRYNTPLKLTSQTNHYPQPQRSTTYTSSTAQLVLHSTAPVVPFILCSCEQEISSLCLHRFLNFILNNTNDIMQTEQWS